MFCKNCGFYNTDENEHCAACGTQLSIDNSSFNIKKNIYVPPSDPTIPPAHPQSNPTFIPTSPNTPNNNFYYSPSSQPIPPQNFVPQYPTPPITSPVNKSMKFHFFHSCLLIILPIIITIGACTFATFLNYSMLEVLIMCIMSSIFSILSGIFLLFKNKAGYIMNMINSFFSLSYSAILGLLGLIFLFVSIGYDYCTPGSEEFETFIFSIIFLVVGLLFVIYNVCIFIYYIKRTKQFFRK